jgi:hypothetical protein
MIASRLIEPACPSGVPLASGPPQGMLRRARRHSFFRQLSFRALAGFALRGWA